MDWDAAISSLNYSVFIYKRTHSPSTLQHTASLIINISNVSVLLFFCFFLQTLQHGNVSWWVLLYKLEFLFIVLTCVTRKFPYILQRTSLTFSVFIHNLSSREPTNPNTSIDATLVKAFLIGLYCYTDISVIISLNYNVSIRRCSTGGPTNSHYTTSLPFPELQGSYSSLLASFVVYQPTILSTYYNTLCMSNGRQCGSESWWVLL